MTWPFCDGAFDDAIVCLVLHYLEDWKAPLAELRRVPVPGGRLIVAVNHPFGYKLQYPDADYFAPREYSEEYTFSGQNAVLTYWHRPLHAMTAACSSSSTLPSATAGNDRTNAGCYGTSPRSVRKYPPMGGRYRPGILSLTGDIKIGEDSGGAAFAGVGKAHQLLRRPHLCGVP